MSAITDLINSMKGIAGSGNVLAEAIERLKSLEEQGEPLAAYLRTMEPGDIVRTEDGKAVAAPIAYDVWYLYCAANMLKNYQRDIDGDHFNYGPYLAENMSFLSLLPGLKPARTLRNLGQLVGERKEGTGFWEKRFEWYNNGIYWINTMAWELWRKENGAEYASDGPKGFSPNDYVGYLTFPVGQLGVMEVISLMQETGLSGYPFAGGKSPSAGYIPKPPVSPNVSETPSVQTPPEMFPEMKDAGQNYCYGRHLVESAYLIPEIPVASQNTYNSQGGSAYSPVPKSDVELMASGIKDYEDVKPKMWMRYWIHKDSTLPVPGEFIGILCRPVAAPPHVWWFQESAPFLYAGNWMETLNLTSGVITSITLEENRTDGGTGNQYNVKIQGCEVIVDATDFFEYAVGERVAVLKVGSTVFSASDYITSFTWREQTLLKDTDKLTKKANYVILPATFYKIAH